MKPKPFLWAVVILAFWIYASDRWLGIDKSAAQLITQVMR